MKELEDYNKALQDFEVALSNELSHEERNDDMIRYIKNEIMFCQKKIAELEDV